MRHQRFPARLSDSLNIPPLAIASAKPLKPEAGSYPDFHRWARPVKRDAPRNPRARMEKQQ
jgi:hypothetical protein